MRKSHHVHNDPKMAERIAKQQKRDHRVEHVYRRILHFIERAIAAVTIIVLLVALGMEFYKMLTTDGYWQVDTYLHNVLNVVVGLEFVRMLVDMTPVNTLEVLIVAISRHVILTQDRKSVV